MTQVNIRVFYFAVEKDETLRSTSMSTRTKSNSEGSQPNHNSTVNSTTAHHNSTRKGKVIGIMTATLPIARLVCVLTALAPEKRR